MGKGLVISTMVALSVFAPRHMATADEIRVGVMVHDVQLAEEFIFGGRHGKEQSISLSGEYVFGAPDWLSWALGARPYIGGTINFEGETSHGGFGALWRTRDDRTFYGELAIGLVAHDGAIRTPDPLLSTDPIEVAARRERKFNEIEFGADVLFRTQFALGYRIDEKWAGELVFEHLSHGQILGGPENEGSNNLGVRFARRF